MTPESIEELYVKHGHSVLCRCRQLLGDGDGARDAVHDVFLELLEQPERFRRLSSPATYLFAIATHLCLRRIRDRRARDGRWQANVARALEDGRPSAEASAEARDLAGAIVAQADPEIAAIALFHFVDGLTQGEIATLIGRSRVTVNQKLRRFREQARVGREAP